MSTDSKSQKIRHILAAIDGSEYAEKAGIFAVDLAKKFEARLILLHIASYPTQYLGLTGHDVAVGLPMQSREVENMKKRARESIERISEIARSQIVSVRTEFIETQSPIVDSIADTAERESIQIIVVGMRGLGNFDPFVVGSVASGLINRARCSVLVVR